MPEIAKDLGRFIVTIFICGLIIVFMIHYGPCGIEHSIKMEWIGKNLSAVLKCFGVSIKLILFASFFSSLFLFASSNPVNKSFFTFLSCCPAFVAGILVLRAIPSVTGFIMGGLILGLCDGFFIELYRHKEIEVSSLKGEPYVLMAKANGLKGARLLWYLRKDFIIHFLKVFTSKLVILISSAVVIEWIFNIKGIGNLLIITAEQKDIEQMICIEGVIVGFVLLVSFLNRIMDRRLDPRLREG